MAELRLDAITKAFGPVQALRDVSLAVPDGEVLAVVGPSGCGKSTLLRIVAGLEEPSSGDVSIGGRRVTDLAPGRRAVAIVFQEPATFPYLTVADNLAFGLRVRGVRRAEGRRRAAEVAEVLGLSSMLDRRPSELSGGERQRVGIGRAMLRTPDILLMDEPLSSLDVSLRLQMRAELAELHRRLGTTTLYVTHDQGEAMTLGDRVAVLHQGVVQQVGTPDELFERPASVVVAELIGSPPMDLIDAVAVAGDGAVRAGPLWFPLGNRADLSGPVVVGFRPSDLVIAAGALPTGWAVLDVTVDALEDLGDDLAVVFKVPGQRSPALRGRIRREERPVPGQMIRFGLDPACLHLFDPATGRARLRP